MNAGGARSRRTALTLAVVITTVALLTTQLGPIGLDRAAGPSSAAPTGSLASGGNLVAAAGSVPLSGGAVAIGATVASTLDLLNGTFTPGAARTFNTFAPNGIVYAPPSNQVFVSEVNSQALTVLNATTLAIIGLIPSGSFPTAGVFDPSNGMVYIANYESSNLSVIDPRTDTAVASISVPVQGDAIAWDSANGYLYVANGGGDDVAVINPVSQATVATITVGDYVSGVAVDSANGDVYATTDVAQVVGVIDGSTNTLTKTLAIGANSLSICFDAANGYIYAGNAVDNNITVIDGATNLEVGTITTYGPGPMVVDPANDELYVAAGDELISAIATSNGTTLATMPIGSFPTGITLDTLSGDLFVGNRYSDNVSVIDPSSQRTVGSILMGVGPSSIVADPAAGLIVLFDSDLSELLLVDRDHRSAGTIKLSDTPSAITYDSTNGLLYVLDTYPAAALQAFDLSTRALVYDFLEPGLAVGTSIGYDPAENRLLVTMAGTDQLAGVIPANGTLLGYATVGANPNAMAIDPASGLVFVNDAHTGNLTVVDDASMSVVTTLAIGGSASCLTFDPADGDVYVTQPGVSVLQVFDGASAAVLPNVSTSNYPEGLAYDPNFGGLWNLDGSASNASLVVGESWESTINVTLPAVPNAAAFDPATGTTSVLSSSAGAVYTLVPSWGYPATFSAVGLPSTDDWTLNVAGQVDQVHGTTETLDLPDGSYTFTAIGPVGFGAAPSTGAFQINGSGALISIAFSRLPALTYPVSFTESGLPSSTPWTVTVNGSVFTATGTSLTAPLPNGSFGFFVGEPVGYRSAPPDGVVAVRGSGIAVSISFSPAPPGVSNTSSTSGTTSTTTTVSPWWIALLVAAVTIEAIAVAVLALALRRRERLGSPGVDGPATPPAALGPPAGAVGPAPGTGTPPPPK